MCVFLSHSNINKRRQLKLCVTGIPLPIIMFAPVPTLGIGLVNI